MKKACSGGELAVLNVEIGGKQDERRQVRDAQVEDVPPEQLAGVAVPQDTL
jgi:hypothetical protein